MNIRLCHAISKQFSYGFPSVDSVCVFALVGRAWASDTLDVWSVMEVTDMNEQAILQAACQIPAGLDVVGLVFVIQSGCDLPELSSSNPLFILFRQLFHSGDFDDLSLLAVCDRATLLEAGDLTDFRCCSFDDLLIPTPISGVRWVPSADIRLGTLSLSLRLSLDINLPVDDVTGEVEKGDEEKEFGRLELDLESSDVYFRPKGSRLLLGEDGAKNPMDSALKNCSQLWTDLNPDWSEGVGKRKKGGPLLQFPQNRLEFTCLRKSSGDALAGILFNCVPIIHVEKRLFTTKTVNICLDTVAVCSETQLLANVHGLLWTGIRRRLRSIRFEAATFEERNFSLFLPEGLPHFLCLTSPSMESDVAQLEWRRVLHNRWGISKKRPVFRSSQSFRFPEESGPYLRNVHVHVGPSGVGGASGSVSGDYEYRHYMQDGCDDQGWGCAYRSFQTVWSWFLLQGCTDRPVPSHSDIQQALVDVGDRESKFVGSREWIGSLELSFCLEHLLDVSSRILSVSSGAEMASRARELLHHFRTVGSPVMIGGGLLAHTILGVDFNQDSGLVKFLVLDPHYTGEENVQTVVDKGWCGWKPVSFWDPASFYNMLLPEPPSGI